MHDRDDPEAPLDPVLLRRALGPHAPPTLSPDSPHQALSGGGTVTVEPGGQVEISSAPAASLTVLRRTVDGDMARLMGLLGTTGLRLGSTGIDPYRPPRRLLETPRYAAMQRAFDARGPHGRTMMCSTAGLQVCLDAGEPHRVAGRWAAAHALGPTAARPFRERPPARRPGHRLGVRPDARLARHRPAPDRAGRCHWCRGRRSGHRLGPVRARRAAAVRTPGRNDWDAPPGVTLRRLDRRGAARTADHRRPGLPPGHAVPAGTPAGLPGAALPGRAAGAGLVRAGRGAGRAVRRRRNAGRGPGGVRAGGGPLAGRGRGWASPTRRWPRPRRGCST